MQETRMDSTSKCQNVVALETLTILTTTCCLRCRRPRALLDNRCWVELGGHIYKSMDYVLAQFTWKKQTQAYDDDDDNDDDDSFYVTWKAKYRPGWSSCSSMYWYVAG